ncbi:Uncharacterised protein [Actinobacillus pleuropneumoniae]|nr:Uncharacterised protein [Actinobacillus pleuropneumoniae]
MNKVIGMSAANNRNTQSLELRGFRTLFSFLSIIHDDGGAGLMQHLRYLHSAFGKPQHDDVLIPIII